MEKIIINDCRNIDLEVGSIDLVIADPPYNIGLKYNGNYDDDKETEDFLKMIDEVVYKMNNLLKEDGSIFFFMGSWLQAEVLVILKKYFYHRRTIIWYNTFGQSQQNNFTSSWTAIHYLTKNFKKFTFNADAIRIPSARQLIYKDKRANPKGKVPDDVWVLLPNEHPEFFKANSDLWLESRVCGTFKERVKHVTQLPLPLVERIIKVASNPGDLVLDPFMGTGTTLVAARNLDRSSIGVEICEETAKVASERLLK